MQASKYINLAFVKADTCVVERLFSITRKVWREDKKSMTQAHMELVMFLKCNRDLWDSHLVFKCRTNPRIRAVVAAAAAVADDQAAPVVAGDGGAALGELVAFLVDFDAEALGQHENVFIGEDNDADLPEPEEDEEVELEDPDSDFSDEEFANV